ncbi:putative DNA-binding protein [Phytophthora cinnamomi]|uniref:putative DNA-binding protein n=1 Tax=Phytophthora cinnamomi TaxID=4785 RepID=UPI00355A57D9|nr:putative DNA-binding protein [Phytophthora cinnamomi]
MVAPAREDAHCFLNEEDELEVLGVQREHFRHKQRITSDDVRFVVRAVPVCDGAASIPPDFLSAHWILGFKRAHGFALLSGSGASFPLGNSYDSSQESASSEKRGYKQSHTVPPETWEKAVAAVEQHGMNLRAAVNIYGGNNEYFYSSDEAGAMRLAVALAELSVLMAFGKLMKLVETTALRNMPTIYAPNALRLMVRSQTRNE